jgi:hypothetical protein
MHRMIEISVPPDVSPKLHQPLLSNPMVINFSLQKGGSQKPAGYDVLQVHVLNRGTDNVLSLVHQYCGKQNFSVVTSEVASLTDPANETAINHDVDEAIWEEVQTGMRHNGRLTPNFVMLMAIGGIITAVGFVANIQLQVISFIAASIIAPGLEPVAKFSLGIVLRKKQILWSGFTATLVGYATLMLSAAIIFAVLLSTGSAKPEEFTKDDLAMGLQDVTLKDFISSLAASAASIIMYLSYRRNVIAGPLIGLVTIPAAAGAAMGVVLGNWHFAKLLLFRMGVDFALIIVVGMFFVWIKQKLVHKRKPLL